MAAQPEEEPTIDLLGEQKTAEVIDFNKMQEPILIESEDVLLAKHGYVKAIAFIKNKEEASKKSASAARQFKFSKKKAEVGEVKTWVPREIVEVMKEAGGAEKVKQLLSNATPTRLSEQQKIDMSVGRSVRKLSGWHSTLVNWVLKLSENKKGR